MPTCFDNHGRKKPTRTRSLSLIKIRLTAHALTPSQSSFLSPMTLAVRFEMLAGRGMTTRWMFDRALSTSVLATVVCASC